MQITHHDTSSDGGPGARPGTPRPSATAYRERLTPSLWALVAAAVVAPMAALVFAPFDATVALVVGVLVGIGAVTLLIVLSPLIAVSGGMLRAGRARIDVSLVGSPVALTAEAARVARGPGLDPRGWHLIRGGIDGLVVVPDVDPDDPVQTWTISSRTPDRLAAAIVRAQSARRA